MATELLKRLRNTDATTAPTPRFNKEEVNVAGAFHHGLDQNTQAIEVVIEVYAPDAATSKSDHNTIFGSGRTYLEDNIFRLSKKTEIFQEEDYDIHLDTTSRLCSVLRVLDAFRNMYWPPADYSPGIDTGIWTVFKFPNRTYFIHVGKDYRGSQDFWYFVSGIRTSEKRELRSLKDLKILARHMDACSQKIKWNADD